jgi:hypothetical protein
LTSVNSFCQVASSSWGWTCSASMPGYQLKRLTMPSAWISGLVANSTNCLATSALAALAGTM